MTDELSLRMIPDAVDVAASLLPSPDPFRPFPPALPLPARDPGARPPVSAPPCLDDAADSVGTVPERGAGGRPAADDVRWLDRLWSSRLVGEGMARPSLAIGLLLWPGFSLFTLALLQEALTLAGDAAQAAPPRLVLLGPMAADAGSAAVGVGAPLPAETPYVRPDDLDLLLVLAGPLPGERPAPREANDRESDGRNTSGKAALGGVFPDPSEASRHRDYLRVAAAAGLIVGGCGGGVRVLAQEGLLANRRVCFDPRLHADFPGLETVAAEAVIDQGRITTADGMGVLAVLLPLIRVRLGAEAAARVEAGLRLPPPVEVFPDRAWQASGAAMTGADGPHPAQPEASVVSGLPEARMIADPRIARAVVLIEARAGRDVSPSEMARAAGLSARQFSRLFRATLGMTPKHFILQTRLERARTLVEQGTLSMAAIAEQTGFADCAHFTTAFKARYGTAPRNLRPKRAPR